eukprot:TRINITY_DN29355_c1_g1_i3.p1 TRINITY_DN29355_c1_g1~~TRINITY_DN29355_c1_g1_i3.p1  ORF type:complete len:343 (-),score=-2.94 TRINITY_DN29355_c1_g1_i3:229-1257(-)
MGYSALPQIAQKTATTLAEASLGSSREGASVTWMDNILFGASEVATLQGIASRFRALCARYGFTLGDVGEIRTRGCVLGIEMDLADKRFRLSPEWCTSTSAVYNEFSSAWSLSRRVTWRLIGCLIWRFHVLRHRLGPLLPLLCFMSETASIHHSAIRRSAFWEEEVKLPQAARTTLHTQFQTLKRNDWVPWVAPPRKEVIAFTDASLRLWSFIHNNEASWGPFPPQMERLSIFMLELFAVFKLSHHLATQTVHPATFTVFCDNTGVVSAVNNGYSLAHGAQPLITDIHSQVEHRGSRILLRYIHTKLNPADAYSRHTTRLQGASVRLPEALPQYPHEVQTHP